MSVPHVSQPPTTGGSYVIPQYEGEVISIPGSKSVFRILTSAIQSDNGFAVFSSGGALADAPGFHHHNEAHDVFMVTKGFLKLWNGEQCRILGPGDFASIPPGIIHNPKLLGPVTETFGLITPGDWIDFFRYVSEAFDGVLYPEFDTRDLKEHIIPKVMAAQGKYDVHFHPHHVGCAVSEWGPEDEKLPESMEPYFLRANTGPRWVLGGVMSRPFATTKQTGGKFSISSIESSDRFGGSVFDRKMSFPNTHHCFAVFEGKLDVQLGSAESTTITEGDTLFLPKGTPFSLTFATKFVRLWSFSTGDGIEALIHTAGKPFAGFVIPDKVQAYEEAAFESACKQLGVSV